MRPTTVTIANDYPVVVAGLVSLLGPFSHRVQIAEVSLDETQDRPVDVTLFDAFDAHGTQHSVSDILDAARARRVIAYSWSSDAALVARALASGFAGYISKAAHPRRLVDAIERVAAGKTNVEAHAPDEDEESGGEGMEKDDSHPRWTGMEHELSPREAEMVALITQGLTNQDITEHSFLSINTAKTYIRTAYQKMGVTRRAEAVRWGVEHGLLSDQYTGEQ